MVGTKHDDLVHREESPSGIVRVGSPPRFLFYSHDGQGLGHTRRNLAIAAALNQLDPRAVILLVTGTDEVHRLGLSRNVGVLKLPGLRKLANNQYEGRRLHIPPDDLWTLRSTLLTAAVQSFRPDVLLTDKHPLGVNGELRPALDRLRADGGRTALGLRDILDDPATVISEWARYDLQQSIADYYDRILIYGHEAVFNPVREYHFSPVLAERSRFCGYILNTADRDEENDNVVRPIATVPRDRPLVLATPGGGEDGFALLYTFIKAATGAHWRGIVVSGPLAHDDDHETLRRLAAENGVTFFTFITGLAETFAEIDALVCMGGYNTLVEALTHGIPTICVPRIAPRTEQLMRARSLARLNLLQLIEPIQLEATSLRTAIDNALVISRPGRIESARQIIDFNGSHHVARQLLELAHGGRQAATVVAPTLRAAS